MLTRPGRSAPASSPGAGPARDRAIVARVRQARHDRLPLTTTIAFGLVVICAFGSWLYGYGVLLEPIRVDTGWSESVLSSAYGIGMLAVGLGTVTAGRVVDTVGPRPVFVVSAAGVIAGTTLVVTASTPLAFGAGAVLTQGFVGTAGYYTVVHATIARRVPADRTRAITVNTMWGAFASPVFLPLLGFVAQAWGWRPAMVLSGVLVTGSFLFGAAVSPSGSGVSRGEAGTLRAALAESIRDETMRRLLYVAVCSGVASSVLFLYQVPAMVSAGLVLGLASALAGLRGLFQLLGRLPLPWLVNRFGARQVFQVGLALVGVSSLLLLVSGNVVVAVVFAVVAGASVGASSTLESIYSAQVVQVRLIGLFLGLYSMIWGLGSAVGPVIAGFVTEATGTRLPVFVGIAIIGVLGALVIPRDPGRRDA